MESVVFKYSDFFDNDGGFDRVRKEFDELGDDLIKKAKEVREKTKLFDVDQSDQIKEAEQQAESLVDAFKKYGDAKEDLNKIEKEYLKQKKKENQTTDDQIQSLVDLDKQLQKYRGDLKEIQTLTKLGIKTDRDLNKERIEAEINIKKVNKEIRKQQTEIVKSNELSRDEQKLLKAKLVLEKEEIKTLQDVRERMSALRVVVQSLDFEEQADQIKAYNDEINELTDVLSDNSDKFIQSKINIGNYEESITNALKSSDAFKTGIGGLDGVLQSVLGVFLLTRAELEAMEQSADANTNAIKKMTIAFGKLNKVLKASIIGVVLVAIGALASAFGNTRAGAVRLEKVMATLSTAFTTFGQVSKIIFQEIGDGIKSIRDFLANPFAKQQKKTATDTESAWERIKKAIESGKDAIVEGLDNIDRAFKLEDRVKRLTQEIERLNGVLQITQSIADDSTKSLSTQLLASKKALELSEQVGNRELEIAKSRLDIANERVKQNIKANAVEASNIDLSLQGESFAKATLDLAERRGVSLEIANDLIDEQQSALLDVIKAENDLNITRQENSRQQREINRDLFEQNLDLLIDLIDTQKNVSEEFVNDTTKVFKARINEFNRFLIVFRQNAQKELDEFNKLASTSAKLAREELSKIDPTSSFGKEQIQTLNDEIKKLEGIDFQISFDENGDFEVFNNGVKLTLADIVELNKQLQELGIAEIPVNRFREFNVETTNAVRDFKALNKELNVAGILFKELSLNVIVSQDELDDLDRLQVKIDKLAEAQKNATSTKERNRITKQIVELEKEKELISQTFEAKRLVNRKNAIEEELKQVDEANKKLLDKKGELTDEEIEIEKQLSQRGQELRQESLDVDKQIQEKGIDDELKRIKEANDKKLAEEKKHADEVRQVLDLVLDKVLEVNQKRVESAEKQVDRQNELIDVQRDRAQAGLENTLAFEQRELGKREAELIKRQKRQERLEKIKALYSSYNNYSSRGDENAIAKALRDFAILEAISASFKDGGITGVDGVKTNQHGVTVGKKHNANGTGGNLAWHERGEGFFPKKAVDNIGHRNFYKLKEMALNGNMDSNFFSGQRKEFINTTNMIVTDPELKNEMRQVREAVERKPVSNWRVEQITKGTMDVVEEVMEKNSIKRNHYRIKKPRP